MHKEVLPQVKYGVRSLKFIWAPVYSSTHWLRPRNPKRALLLRQTTSLCDPLGSSYYTEQCMPSEVSQEIQMKTPKILISWNGKDYAGQDKISKKQHYPNLAVSINRLLEKSNFLEKDKKCNFDHLCINRSIAHSLTSPTLYIFAPSSCSLKRQINYYNFG